MTDSPAQPIDRKLQAEAHVYEVPYKAYANMSPRERAMAKAQWTRKLKVEARRRGLDPEDFVAMTEDERQNAREQNPERDEKAAAKKKRPRPKPTSMDDLVAKHAGVEDEDEDMPAQVSTAGDTVPPTESDARRRSQMTIGPINVVEDEDLVGVAPPKTLQDIYARWPVGDGQHYLRVERVQPKVWEKIAVAGYLGEISSPISEEEFQRYFGGKEYLVTLYGPDPKGRRDPNTDEPIIKAKTEAIKVTVPMLPPNLRVLPAAKATKKEEVAAMAEINPFQTLFGMGAGVPATPAEATMHRTSVDFMEKLLKRGDEESRDLRRELDKRGQMSGDVLKVISDSSRQAVDAATKAADSRERALAEQLAEERAERRRLEQKLDAVVEKGRGGDDNTLKTLQLLNPAEATRQANEAAREALAAAKERHGEEVRHLRETHQTTVQALKESHQSEMNREHARYRDLEEHYRRKIDDVEKHAEKREKELKDEIDRVRRDERDVAAERVRETEKRFEDRIRDMKEQHDRELRMNEQHATTRIETQKTTLDFQRLAAEERAQAAREEAERLRQEVDDAKDPIKVKEKAESLAEAFGFTKADENAPQTATERLASGVGMGLGKALEGIQDWLPKTMREVAEIRSAARTPGLPPGMPQPRQLPTGMPPGARQQGSQAPQQRRSRAVAWASKADVPIDGAQPHMPANDVGWQPAESAPQPTNGAGAPAQAQAAPQAQQSPQQPAPPGAGAVNVELQNRFGAAGITAEYIQQFRAEVERAVETGFSATVFAERFAQAYPEPSFRLATGFTPQDLFHVVEAMGGAESPVLRRDGKKWVESLWQALQEQHAGASQPQVPANA